MYFCEELVMWIAAEFTWKGLNGTTFEILREMNINTTPTINPKASPQTNYNFNRIPSQLLVEFDIELQLTKRCAPGPSDPEGNNEYYLKVDTFRLKEFHVRLEEGLFMTPGVADDPGSIPFLSCRYFAWSSIKRYSRQQSIKFVTTMRHCGWIILS